MMFKSLLQRLAGRSAQNPRRRGVHRGLRLERLDKRAVLAADIGAITGTVFIDLDGDGLDATDTRLAAVDVNLFRDGGNGVFGGDDVAVGSVPSGSLAGPTPGQYRFDNLSPGLYFVQQDNADAPAGLINPTPASVTLATGSVRVLAIDLFNQTSTPTLLADTANLTATSNLAASEAIGGERNILLTRTGGTGNLTLQVNSATSRLIAGSSSAAGTALLQYDGTDGSIALNPIGLGGLDLDASDPRAGVIFEIESAVPSVGGGIDLTIYTSATLFSTANVTYPATANPGPVTVFVPFSSFSTGSGAAGPADFTSVGAIEELVTLVTDQDVRVSLVESARPEAVTANLTNFQPLTIGDLVFQDNDNSGVFNAGDVGIVGVDVELYSVATATSVVNPATDTLVATQTTGAGGAYSFTNVRPGFYAIVIPAREFDASSVATGSRTLVGFVSSTPVPQTPGADANVDNDNDGRAVSGQLYVATQAVTLISGTEPTVSGNTNNTFDFGFVSNADLGITKGNATITTSPTGDRTATFRIDVVNNGPLTATGISVVDTLPAGLTFVGVTSVADPLLPPPGVTTTSVNGQAVTINLSNLGSTSGTSFNLVATVGASVFGDQTNSATVNADQADPVSANDTDTGLLDLPVNDLSIVKTLETTTGAVIPPGIASTGDTVVYRLVVNNTGDNATGVTVVDTLPTGVTFVSGTINGGAVGSGITFNAGTRQVTAAVGNVTTGTPAVILIRVTINANAGSLITNSATVSNLPDTDNVTANDTSSVDNSVTRAVDLAIVKAVSTTVGDNTTAVFGAPITFVLTVTNTTTSPGDARGFTVTDTLPAGLTFVTGSFVAGSSGVTLVNNGQQLTFTGGALAVGASASFKFNALVAQSAGATIVNTATVAPINAGGVVDVDSNAANNSDPETVTPARNVELAVTKDDNFAGTATAAPGGNIIYTIVVSNTGTSDAANVTVTDTLPPGVTATSITLNGATVTDNDPSAGVLAFSIPSLPTGAGNALTYIVNATIAASVSAASITNSVTVSGGGTGDLPAGNTATVTTPLAPIIDVGVVKTGPTGATPGGTALVYNLAISNAGPSNATNVNVADDLPAGVTIQSVTLNGTPVTNTGTNGDVAFVIPTLGVGAANAAAVVITVLVDAAATGTLSNTATVTTTGDLNAANNTSTITTPLTPVADVTVTKTVNNPTAAPGTSLTYTIQVRNGGVSTAAGVTLVDVLPTGLTFTSGTGPNNQVLTANGQTVNVAVGTLAPNATSTYTIIAAIGSTFTGTLTNPATVATTTSEGANALPNSASAVTTVQTVDPLTASISGRVFLDVNRNGLFDGTDVGIPGVTMRLRNTGNTAVLQTLTTAADGTYSFTLLAAGTYDVEQIQPAGVRDGLEQAGPGSTPVEIADGIFRAIGLAQAQQVSGFNFAEIELLSKRRFLASTPT